MNFTLKGEAADSEARINFEILDLQSQRYSPVYPRTSSSFNQDHAFNPGFPGDMKSRGPDLANARFRVVTSCVPQANFSRQPVKLYLLLLP